MESAMMSRVRTEARVDEWPFQPWPAGRRSAVPQWTDAAQEQTSLFSRSVTYMIVLAVVLTLGVAASMGFAVARLSVDQINPEAAHMWWFKSDYARGAAAHHLPEG
jgi:hypothetical protein